MRPWNDPHADIRLALAGPSSTILAARASGAPGGDRDGRLGRPSRLDLLSRRGARSAAPGDRRADGEGGGGLARERDAPKLNLLVRAENAAVLGFYELLGYRRSDTVLLQRVLR